MTPTDHDLIAKWLGLPAGSTWPPDHYTLLGLAPGEPDSARIEQQVHARLSQVRGYQLSHPGAATEAMNRLAQAFACLTDPQARRTYDAATFPTLAVTSAPVPEPAPVALLTAPAPQPTVPTVAGGDTLANGPQTAVDWRATAPPVRLPGPSTETPMPGAIAGWPPPGAPTSPSGSGVLRLARRADPVLDAARTSPEARRGLGTRKALFERVTTTRELLRLWDRAGRYLGRAKRKLTRPAEEKDLVRVLNEIDELLQQFPPLLGEPGKPGYRVTALVHEESPPAVLRSMDPEQREALARDWQTGQTLLQSHLEFLRKELDAVRRCGWCGRAARAVSAAVHDHPAWVGAGVLVLLGATAAVFFLG